jgi:hypothetical protein
MATTILELFFFRVKNFCNYNSNNEVELKGKNVSKHSLRGWGLWFIKKEPPKEGSCINQL